MFTFDECLIFKLCLRFVLVTFEELKSSTMKFKFKLVGLVFICAFLLCDCKKGEEDPAISFRTRKGRLSGEWVMKSGNASQTFLSATKPPFNQNFSFNGSKVELNETEAGGPAIIYTGAYNLTLNVKKDGAFNFRENFAGSILEANGHWNFERRSADAKNKEEVEFTIDATTKGATIGHVFNQQQITFSYKLVQLANKDLKIEALTKSFISSNGDQVNFTSRYTFAQS